MENILTESVKVGKFQVPMGLLLLSGAALLAVVALSSKKGGGQSGGGADALVGQYDPSFDESAGSVSAPPSYTIPPQTGGAQTPIVNVDRQPAQQTVNQPGLIDIESALAQYEKARGMVDHIAGSFPSFGGVQGVKSTYQWYDPAKNVLIDGETKARFYG